MVLSYFGKAVITPLALLFALLGLTVQGTDAQEKPFKIVGAGIAVEGLPLPGQPARPHWSVGVATQLGLHSGLGTIKTDTAVPDFEAGVIRGEFGSGSPFAFVRPNGDKLVTQYGRKDKGAKTPGEFELTIVNILEDGSLVVTAEFIAEFVVQPELSTGKFAGATGSWIMIANSAPFVLGSSDPTPYTWHGEGSLKFKKK